MSTATPSQVVKSIQAAGPAFASAFARAPAAVDYKGKRYSRLSATTPVKKAWYLAAAAMSNPAGVARLSPLHRTFDWDGEGAYFLDADPSELNAAKARLGQAQAKVKAVQLKLQNQQREMRRWEAEKQKAATSYFKDVGSVLSLGIANVAGEIGANAKIGWYKDRIEETMRELTDAQGEVEQARAAVQSAQAAYDAENRRIRQEEELARQEQLRQRSEEAARRAAEEAAARDAWAQQQQQTYYQPWPGQDAYTGGTAPQVFEPWNALPEQFPFPDDYFGDASYLDAADVEDVSGGDPSSFLHALGEDAPGLTRYPSAWSFDAYYARTPEDYLNRMFGSARLERELGQHPGAGYGADGGQPMMSSPVTSQPSASSSFDLVGLIIAAILAIAPIILAELAGQGPAPSEIAPTLAENTGLEAYVNEKADRAGEKAGANLIPAALIVAGALILGS